MINFNTKDEYMSNKCIYGILENTKKLISEYNTKKPQNGEQFNLLVISGINRLEVNVCKILAELIKPDGLHNQEDLFLKSFVRDVLNISMSDEELKNAKVVTEYLIDDNRRIDISIETPLRFIPIEAKLYAKDQKKQCADYYRFAKRKSELETKVYYLTLDGHLPYEDEGLTPIEQDGEVTGYEELETISFKDDIYAWLEKISEKVIDKPMLYASLIQLKEALGKSDERMKREMYEEVSSIISQNSETMRAAYAIAESITVAKENLMIKLFERLENEMKLLEFPLEQLNNKFYYKYDNYSSVHDYYSKKRNKIFPALVYRYKKLNAGKEIWFMIEVGVYGTIYFGFVIAKNGDKSKKLLISDSELEKHIKLPFGLNKDECWFFWQFLPEHTGDVYDIDKFPNFKDTNDHYRNLFDCSKFDDYIDLCISRIKTVLNKMIGTKGETDI